MELARLACRSAVTALLLLATAAPLPAQDVGQSVIKRGTINEDLYLAGGTVDVLADVDGDVVAAGGRVTVDASVTGDVAAAGGSVSIRARVGDDARLAGGEVMITGQVRDDAIVAGGRVTLAPTATVGGRAWLGGGRVEVAGTVGRELKVGAGQIVLSGEVLGDATLAGESIDIRPQARIHGNLVYWSAGEARIDKQASIGGSVTRMPGAPPTPQPMARGGARGGAGIGLGIVVSVIVAGIVLYLLFPGIAVAAARRIGSAPWSSLGLGLAVIAATPLVIALSFASLVGIWLGLILTAAYLVLMFTGFLTGVLYVGRAGLRLARRDTNYSKPWHVAAIAAAVLAVALLGLIPYVGVAVFLALLLWGVGSLSLELFGRYSGTRA